MDDEKRLEVYKFLESNKSIFEKHRMWERMTGMYAYLEGKGKLGRGVKSGANSLSYAAKCFW